ncbi:serine hydrolase domain-containing protein [Streptomyces sp. NPDC053048]|uniref:serine hydrolase domain-containing protein n=1 Tax=Streptomyces sp. NPDC053048 TaxID=3365694 RepID=UPI0037CED9D1
MCVGLATAGLLAVPAVTPGAVTSNSVAADSVTADSPRSAAFSTSTGSSGTDTEFPQLSPAVAARLDTAIRRVMSEASVPGVIVSLSAPGKGNYVRAFGVADKANGTPMDPGLYMRIGSETKTFTVTALLELVDAGKVKLDDPISRYIDNVPNGDRITLRYLADMRSGLFNYSADPDFYKALTSDPTRHFTPQELLAYSFKHPVQFQPGAEFEYCNTNLILLGLVVEKIGGQPLRDFIHQKVLQPAGLHHTLFPAGAEFPSPHAHGYTQQTASGAVEDATYWNPSWGWAAGAMISNLQDMRTWARVLATGALLTPQTQAERLKTPPTSIPGAGYGLGIFNVQGWIGHNGSLPGYESLTIYLPEERATLVVLLNTDILHNQIEPSTLFGKAITEIVTPDHVFNLPLPQGARPTPSAGPTG